MGGTSRRFKLPRWGVVLLSLAAAVGLYFGLEAVDHIVPPPNGPSCAINPMCGVRPAPKPTGTTVPAIESPSTTQPAQ